MHDGLIHAQMHETSMFCDQLQVPGEREARLTGQQIDMNNAPNQSDGVAHYGANSKNGGAKNDGFIMDEMSQI